MYCTNNSRFETLTPTGELNLRANDECVVLYAGEHGVLRSIVGGVNLQFLLLKNAVDRQPITIAHDQGNIFARDRQDIVLSEHRATLMLHKHGDAWSVL